MFYNFCIVKESKAVFEKKNAILSCFVYNARKSFVYFIQFFFISRNNLFNIKPTVIDGIKFVNFLPLPDWGFSQVAGHNIMGFR